MAKSQNQKLKLLYIVNILREFTDEEHPISTQKLIEKLEEYDVLAERKSIYDDMEQLKNFGYDILTVKSKVNGGYFMGEREFELAELKLLVDAVQASKFITLKKSNAMIKKLENMVSKYDAGKLQRQVYVSNRIKTINESIFYNVDVIHNSLQSNTKISFQYFEWTIDKKMELKKEGELYKVSPFALTFNDENYYLVAYDSTGDKIKHYRVDKIKNIKLLNEAREGVQNFKSFDIATYSGRTFGMYGGKEEIVTLFCDNNMAGVMIDRFGKDIDIRKRDENKFSIRVNVAVSRQFFGWLAGVGSGVVLTEPSDVKDQYKKYLEEIIKQYQ